ncbi:MAG: dTMP kinase, partial [bacterium]|nr:dTMP kinase [bacterium]
GVLVTFEGGEGSGKSCQIEAVYRLLRRKRVPVLKTREPGGTPLAEKIRKLLVVSGSEPVEPSTELLLYAAARAQHMARVIQPALKKGKVVLCDRFTDATMAYQGYARGVPIPLVERCEQMATGGLKPDLTFLLDCPVTVGLKRAKKRLQKGKGRKEDRFEREAIAFHEKVRNGYLKIARSPKNRKRFELIDTRLPPKVVFEKILSGLKKHEIL